MSTAMKKRKIAVLGSRSVGKSSLVKQFIENHFMDSYYPTIESTFAKSVVYKGVEYDCHIIDTAGQDEFSPINSQYAIGIHGYVLVYSITSRNSFNMIQVVHDKLVEFCGVSKIPCVIVGSKCDLSMQRQVDSKDGDKLAKDNECAWVETSAKNNINIGKVFELCLTRNREECCPKSSRTSCQAMHGAVDAEANPAPGNSSTKMGSTSFARDRREPSPVPVLPVKWSLNRDG